MRAWLAALLPGSVGDLVRQRLSAPQCIYVATVWHLETLRPGGSALEGAGTGEGEGKRGEMIGVESRGKQTPLL